jgi:hypothetical protein
MKWIAVALFILASAAHAQDAKPSDKEIAAWNSVQEELTNCTAFWQRVKACAREDTTKEQLEQADRAIKLFTDLAFEVGDNIGMTSDAMASRLKMATENQNDLTEGKCGNLAPLMSKYFNRCKAVAEKPGAAFREYMAK